MSVVVVVTDSKEADGLLRMAYQLAYAERTSLVVLCAEVKNCDLSVKPIDLIDYFEKDELIADIATTLNDEFERSTDISSSPHFGYVTKDAHEVLPTPGLKFHLIQGENLTSAILTLLNQYKSSQLLLGRHKALKGKEHYTDKLFRKAPCSTLIVRMGETEYKRLEKVMVPCSGGPHSLEALTHLHTLSQSQGTVLTPLIVEPTAQVQGVMEEVGEHQLERMLAKVGLPTESHFIQPRVVVNDNVIEGLRNAISDDYDLVVLGCSGVSNVRKMLFSNMSEQMFNSNSKVSVAIYRSAKSRWQVYVDKFEFMCNVTIPQISRQDRVQLHENLHMNSTWNFDFVSLICLSTAIASLGLISNSTAVVIGAMLVAPLMTPMLASGLALVQGNMPMMINASRSIVFGFLAALGIGFLMGLMTPMEHLTAEILARGTPRIADMFIAFISGVAAAHCMSRPRLSAALPGVAIAAALVPPIAATGIALAKGIGSTAQGASVLFITNVICIILGSALTFYAAGIRAKRDKVGRLWVRKLSITLILLMSLLLIPLSSGLINYIGKQFGNESLQSLGEMKTLLKPVLKKFGVYHLEDLGYKEEKGKALLVTIQVHCSRVPDMKILEELEGVISSQLMRPVRVRLRPILILQDEAFLEMP